MVNTARSLEGFGPVLTFEAKVIQTVDVGVGPFRPAHVVGLDHLDECRWQSSSGLRPQGTRQGWRGDQSRDREPVPPVACPWACRIIGSSGMIWTSSGGPPFIGGMSCKVGHGGRDCHSVILQFLRRVLALRSSVVVIGGADPASVTETVQGHGHGIHVVVMLACREGGAFLDNFLRPDLIFGA